ncbi:hypothetical protein [Silvibacterium sp.]|uniref:hypothetical protein n=1 Tax=Silvibacterium sp. TaxID=1964179 RepID=UPI0039E23D48
MGKMLFFSVARWLEVLVKSKGLEWALQSPQLWQEQLRFSETQDGIPVMSMNSKAAVIPSVLAAN